MIDPASVDVSALPWLPLEAKSAFPRQPCVYFAIDDQNAIQYVGRAKNAKQRWGSHHKYKDLKALDGIRIAYLFLPADSLPKVEAQFIARFAPPLNCTTHRTVTTPKKQKGGLRVVTEVELDIDLKQARKDSGRSATSIAAEVGISSAHLYGVESGGAVSLSVLKKWCEILEVEMPVIDLEDQGA